LFLKDITNFIDQPGLMALLTKFINDNIASVGVPVVALNVSGDWSTMTSAMKTQAIEDALKGQTFKNLLQNYFDSGSSSFLSKIEIVANGTVIAGSLDFAIKLATNPEGQEVYQMAIGSTAGAATNWAATGVSTAVISGAGITGIAAAAIPFVIGGIAAYAVTSSLDDMWDYNNNNILKDPDTYSEINKRGGVELKVYAFNMKDLESAIDNCGALDLSDDKKITVVNALTNDTYELVRGKQLEDLVKELTDRGFGTNTFPGETPELYELLKANYSEKALGSDGRFGALDFSDSKHYLLVESGSQLVFPYEGNNFANLIHMPEEGQTSVHSPTFGLDGNDTIIGSNENDVIYGDDDPSSKFYIHYDNNRIVFDVDYPANAIIHDDSLIGGNGADFIHGGEGNDTIYGGSNNGTAETIESGSTVGNYLYGDSGNDIIWGGGAGNDYMDGGSGNDTIHAVGDKAATIFGNDGNDSIIGADGNDIINGGDDNDTIQGNGGNDYIKGGSGDDIIYGGTGADEMIGGEGNDVFYVDNVGDIVTENSNEGTDTVNSSITYTLGDNLENLTLTGSNNINGTGNDLNNKITGNSGNNRLIGGYGDLIERKAA
jgi:Ca2+-binding RTX toxin-like protein